MKLWRIIFEPLVRLTCNIIGGVIVAVAFIALKIISKFDGGEPN